MKLSELRFEVIAVAEDQKDLIIVYADDAEEPTVVAEISIGHRPEKELRYIANLFAAAPEMLSLLKSLSHDQVKDWLRERGPCETQCTYCAAIAKAEGRS